MFLIQYAWYYPVYYHKWSDDDNDYNDYDNLNLGPTLWGMDIDTGYVCDKGTINVNTTEEVIFYPT